jgi:hypothetical protein
LRFAEPWDLADFQVVLDHLKGDGYYLFEGELIEPPPSRKGRQAILEG